MKSEILHIYGPIAINSYGLFIALGVIAFLILVKHDKRYFQLNLENKLLDIIAVSIISGLAGGRLLFLLTEDTSGMSLTDMILPWVGGFSVLGGIIGILTALPLYLRHVNVPTLAFLDLAAIYAPLIHSISRIGCFFAGCCYGCATTAAWAVMYSDAKSFAPLNISIHPTQLYSSLILLAVFFLMYFIVQKKTFATGQLLFVYLLLASTERFIVDFWRADRTILFDSPLGTLSHTQLIAIGMFITSGILLFLVPRKRIK